LLVLLKSLHQLFSFLHAVDVNLRVEEFLGEGKKAAADRLANL